MLLLMGRRNSAIEQGLRSGRSLNAIAGQLERDIRDGIITSRRESRAAGLIRLGAEARNIGTRLVSDYTHMAEAAVDAARAKLYSGNFARLWLDKANRVDGRVTKAVDVANAATLPRLTTVGVSESSEAFNRGRAKYLRLSTDVRLLKVWNSTLDKRTCPRCSDADGTIVFARDRFPLGEPGAIHPRCRCYWDLIGESERYTTAMKPPAAAAPTVAKTKSPPAPSSLRPKPLART